ncbi:MAG TPA: hypothetical protein VEP67_13170, partial [Thiobacillaceae bacterium]|nr:hypothetical protein [Thiobacillaceae bacterium]
MALVLPGERHLKLATWAGGYLGVALENTYYLIRSAVRWGALGLLLGLAGWERLARLIALLGLPVFLILSAALGLGEPRDWLVLPLGLAAGLWLAQRSRRVYSGSDKIPLAESSPSGLRDHSLRSSDRLGNVGHGLAQSEEAGARVVGDGQQAWHWLARLVSISLLFAVGASLWMFPRWNLTLALGGLVYCALLFRYSAAWLILVPAALPLLDLAPWTGRFFWDEFDLLILLTLVVALWIARLREPPWQVSKLSTLLGLLVLAWSISLLLGLLPLQPLDASAFSAYWSHYNSLRLAKGLVWA